MTIKSECLEEWAEECWRKANVRTKAYYYIQIPEGQMCEICKLNKAVERHHPNYDKPFEVNFLCRKCHGLVHSNINKKS